MFRMATGEWPVGEVYIPTFLPKPEVTSCILGGPDAVLFLYS